MAFRLGINNYRKNWSNCFSSQHMEIQLIFLFTLTAVTLQVLLRCVLPNESGNNDTYRHKSSRNYALAPAPPPPQFIIINLHDIVSYRDYSCLNIFVIIAEFLIYIYHTYIGLWN